MRKDPYPVTNPQGFLVPGFWRVLDAREQNNNVFPLSLRLAEKDN